MDMGIVTPQLLTPRVSTNLFEFGLILNFLHFLFHAINSGNVIFLTSMFFKHLATDRIAAVEKI